VIRTVTSHDSPFFSSLNEVIRGRGIGYYYTLLGNTARSATCAPYANSYPLCFQTTDLQNQAKNCGRKSTPWRSEGWTNLGLSIVGCHYQWGRGGRRRKRGRSKKPELSQKFGGIGLLSLRPIYRRQSRSLESGKPSSGRRIDGLAGRGRRGGQPRLLLDGCSPAAGLGHGSSNLLQIVHAKVLDAHLENAIVPWLGPQEEPAVVFGADLLVIA